MSKRMRVTCACVMTLKFFLASTSDVRYALSVVTRQPSGEMNVTDVIYKIRQDGDSTQRRTSLGVLRSTRGVAYASVPTYFGNAHSTSVRVNIGRAGNACLGACIDELLSSFRNIAKVTSYNKS